VNRDPHR